jgi:hypothetical protein
VLTDPAELSPQICRDESKLMKTNLTKRRYKAQKKSACGLCKPYKRGWEDKKTTRDLRLALKHEQEIRDANNGSVADSF